MSRLFVFAPSGREGCPEQLRSLARVPAWGGFLVVTAIEDEENVFHGNTLYYVPDRMTGGEVRCEPLRVASFEIAMKAEGFSLLPAAAGSAPDREARLVVTYDNDALKTRIPSRFQVIELDRAR